eukprot:923898-Lingulodinium_polyedra.AAC.1
MSSSTQRNEYSTFEEARAVLVARSTRSALCAARAWRVAQGRNVARKHDTNLSASRRVAMRAP